MIDWDHSVQFQSHTECRSMFSQGTSVLSEPGVDHSMLISPLVWARLSQFVYRTVGRFAIKCAGKYFMEESIDENNAFRNANALFLRV
jgi:hypothetical protein